MTDERRFSEDEVAEILEAAAAPVPQRDDRQSTGLTLSELQAIGREVGIPPERIAAAANALENSPARMPRRTDFGMPISVGRTIELPRQLTDREWSTLVADLRQTFAARGHEVSQGETRQWSNGNLVAFVEPTDKGHRLRLSTLKSDGMAMNRVGLMTIGMGLFVLASLIMRAAPARGYASALMMAAIGVSALAYNALRLPRWASEREEQMEYIVARARALLGPETA